MKPLIQGLGKMVRAGALSSDVYFTAVDDFIYAHNKLDAERAATIVERRRMTVQLMVVGAALCTSAVMEKSHVGSPTKKQSLVGDAT
jgi:hypothetical protein